ncbi:MAG: hypothetical protein ACI9YB_002875 [Halioglobus sp.]|jgi:hypothetical protein
MAVKAFGIFVDKSFDFTSEIFVLSDVILIDFASIEGAGIFSYGDPACNGIFFKIVTTA